MRRMIHARFFGQRRKIAGVVFDDFPQDAFSGLGKRIEGFLQQVFDKRDPGKQFDFFQVVHAVQDIVDEYLAHGFVVPSRPIRAPAQLPFQAEINRLDFTARFECEIILGGAGLELFEQIM